MIESEESISDKDWIFKVDTNKKITVVTQFLTDDGTDNGELVEVRRLYVQDGKVIDNSFTDVEGRWNIKSPCQRLTKKRYKYVEISQHEYITKVLDKRITKIIVDIAKLYPWIFTEHPQSTFHT